MYDSDKMRTYFIFRNWKSIQLVLPLGRTVQTAWSLSSYCRQMQYSSVRSTVVGWQAQMRFSPSIWCLRSLEVCLFFWFEAIILGCLFMIDKVIARDICARNLLVTECHVAFWWCTLEWLYHVFKSRLPSSQTIHETCFICLNCYNLSLPLAK